MLDWDLEYISSALTTEEKNPSAYHEMKYNLPVFTSEESESSFLNLSESFSLSINWHYLEAQ